MEKMKYLVVGNGIAGLSAAKEIRKNDKEGTIAIVSSESYYTYFRVKLTELLCKDFCDEDILVNSEEWYKENDIKVYLNTMGKNLDVDKNILTLNNGEEIEYEKLLIATGSRPFVPPLSGSDKKGFFALRSLNDLNEMKKYLECCEEVAVIGGGLLGLEAAWSLKELGKKVHVLQHTGYLLENQLDEDLSVRLKEELEREGLIIHTNADVEEISGDDGVVSGIKLKNGEFIDVKSVLVSTGVKPNMDLVADTKVETNRGIVVDDTLKTSVDNIYAAGDVIELNGVTLGLWTAGLEQGRIAGSNMSGGDMTYDVPKAFASLNIGPISLFSAGNTRDADKVYISKDGENEGKIFTKNGEIIGSILYGDTKPMGKHRKAVFGKKKVEEFLEENQLEGTYI